MKKTKKYQIFISSTYTDLVEARNTVVKAILRTHNFPVGMEYFGAVSAKQWKVITESIDTSDYYVLIIGTRYGSIEPESGKSYTQREFEYAVRRGIPVYAFIIDPEVKVSQKDVEKDHIKEFKAFIDEAMDGRTVDTWKNKDELASKVVSALYNAIQLDDRPGWVRIISTNEDNKEIEINKKQRETAHTVGWKDFDESFKVASNIASKKETVVILLYAANSKTGNISTTVSVVNNYKVIHVGNYAINPKDNRGNAKWSNALNLLEQYGLVKARKHSGIVDFYTLTDKGYEVADHLKESTGLSDLNDPLKTLEELQED